jgi:hypothetical protein
VLKLKDGRTLDSGEIRFAGGNAKLPLRDADLRAKFMDCLSTVTHLDADALFERLARLETLGSIHELAGSREARHVA